MYLLQRLLVDQYSHDKPWVTPLVNKRSLEFRVTSFPSVSHLAVRRSSERRSSLPADTEQRTSCQAEILPFYRPVFLPPLLLSSPHIWPRDENMFWFTPQAMNETSAEGTGPAEVLLTSGCRAPLVGPVGGWSRGWAGMASRPPPGSSALSSSSPSWRCWRAATGPANTEPRPRRRWVPV